MRQRWTWLDATLIAATVWLLVITAWIIAIGRQL